jgi:purine-binding chemotaxis protein CheW
MKTESAKVDSGKWLTFWLAGELFGVRVEDVQEVLMNQPLTAVPLAADHIVGLLNLRGQILQAIDLRRRLHFPPREPDQQSSLMVVKQADNFVSLLVDGIGDVLELPPEKWRPPPDTLAQVHRSFVLGICPIEKHVVLGLRVESLSGDSEHAPKPTSGRQEN